MIFSIIDAGAYPLSVLSMVMMVAGLLIMLRKEPRYLWLGAVVFGLGAVAGFLVLGTDIQGR